jgi:methionyl-tRNA formyltransferase
MNKSFRIVFLGTPEFAVGSLASLLERGYDIAAVVTAPDQPAGRGRQLQSPPVKDYARSRGLKVLQPEKLKSPEFLSELAALQADLFIVVAFRMLPEAVWAMPPRGTFNLHASLLPQYRGAAPIQHAILNGEKETGLTTFFLRQAIDTGSVIFQEKIGILPDETAGELHDRMKTAGAGLVVRTVEAILRGDIKPVEQENLVTTGVELKPAPKIFKEHGLIDWSREIDIIYNRIRGLSPYPGAYTYIGPPGGEPRMIKILRAIKTADHPDLPPATLVTDKKLQLGVTAPGGTIWFTVLQQAGKRPLPVAEFLKGMRVEFDWKVGN